MVEPVTLTIAALAVAAFTAITTLQKLLKELVGFFKRRTLQGCCEKLLALVAQMKNGHLLGHAEMADFYKYCAKLQKERFTGQLCTAQQGVLDSAEKLKMKMLA